MVNRPTKAQADATTHLVNLLIRLAFSLLHAVSVRVEREALDELPDEGRLVQCPRVHELAARVDVRHRQLVDLQRRGWLGVRRGGAEDLIRPSHEHRQGRYLGEGAQKTPDALVHLVEIGALGQRPLGGLLVSRARVQASFAARLVRARARAWARVAVRSGAGCGCEGAIAAVRELWPPGRT